MRKIDGSISDTVTMKVLSNSMFQKVNNDSRYLYKSIIRPTFNIQ